MPKHLIESAGTAVPITPLGAGELQDWLDRQEPAVAAWVRANGFKAKPGSILMLASASGAFARVLAGVGGDDPLRDWGGIAERLPAGVYRIDGGLSPTSAGTAALGWALGTYVFDRYKAGRTDFADLLWPAGADRARVASAATATRLVRDLVTTPASDMGPEQLQEAARTVAAEFNAPFRAIVGDDLLTQNYPSIHAVGRASDRAPRLLDFTWGPVDAPKVTLVGKGVCFDTGGLDLKPASGMKNMKKDMGGAAHVLGLGRMIMAAGLPVRLRVLIPAVENSVAGNAMRPMDVIRTRKGITIEIGNTDAEGRVILADALAEAAAEKPALIVDFATLTGAARVALGTELPALFANDDELAAEAVAKGADVADPVWHMPLWKPYRRLIEGKTADITNNPETPQGGAITAALFLAEFVDAGIPWAHLDVMAWNTSSRPGRPEGGEAMGMRAFFEVIAGRFPT